jgi:cysteinyl-tRNA synthetase
MPDLNYYQFCDAIRAPHQRYAYDLIDEMVAVVGALRAAKNYVGADAVRAALNRRGVVVQIKGDAISWFFTGTGY